MGWLPSAYAGTLVVACFAACTDAQSGAAAGASGVMGAGSGTQAAGSDALPASPDSEGVTPGGSGVNDSAGLGGAPVDPGASAAPQGVNVSDTSQGGPSAAPEDSGSRDDAAGSEGAAGSDDAVGLEDTAGSDTAADDDTAVDDAVQPPLFPEDEQADEGTLEPALPDPDMDAAATDEGASAEENESITGAESCGAPETLKAAGACSGRLVGVALAAQYLGESAYANAAREFNYVTAENEMKWGINEPSRGSFNFAAGDQIVSFAEQNGMAVKGHALVWHNQLPAWVSGLGSASEVRAAMVGHIERVMDHYRGEVIAWDVVNEAWDDDGVSMRDSVFLRQLGPEYIDEAFIAARAADPDAKLYYNDYDTENLSPKSNNVYEMVRSMVERGIPIDGVGLQSHLRIPDDEPSIAELTQNMQRIADLGLEVLISELDVRLCSQEGETLEDQAARYHDVVRVCMQQPACTAITLWGITDRYTWLNNADAPSCPVREASFPLLWDDAYRKKPAYDAVMRALLGE